MYSNDLIKQEVIKIVAKHGGRIIDPANDMVFSETADTLVVILDGIDHMQLVPDSADKDTKEEEDEESS